MKNIAQNIFWSLLFAAGFTNIMAQGVSSPRLLNVDKRFNLSYVDSIKKEHLYYLTQLPKIPRAITRDTLKLKTYVYLAYLYTYTAITQRDSSLYWANQTIEEASRLKNNFYKAEGMIKKAEFLERFRSNYQESVEILNNVLFIPNITSKQRFFVRRLIGVIYAKTDNPNATSYIETLINDIKKTFVNEKQRAPDLYNLYIALAETNERKKHFAVSLEAYLNALEEVKKFNQGIGLAYLYASIAQSYIELEKYNEAENSINQAKALFDRLKIPLDESINFTTARMHLKKKEYDKAAIKGETILVNVVARKFKKYSNVYKEASKILYDSYLGLGNYEKALFHYQNYILIKDSLEIVKKSKEIDELIKKYDIQQVKSDNEKQILAKNNQIQRLSLSQYKNEIENQRLKEVLLKEKLEKERVISQDQAKNLERLTEKRRYEDRLEKLTIQQLEEKLSFQEQNRNLWFGLTVITLLLVGAGMIVMVYQSKQKYKFKQREAEYQQRIAQTEISALRAQMNPHFIFNCLNSIQYYAARNEADTASDYLTKFSRLIRLVLENSRSEKVTLTNELETLRLYIEMEAMRFQQKVRYQIQIAPSIDTDVIQIPPLLLQPFVENAIWHGLMHKEEGGNVSITVTQPYDNHLQVIICDDGVGRAKAAEFKSKSATKQKSFGMKVTAQRIELINQIYHTHTHIKIEDIINAQGEAKGTKVIVNIPL
ncbi:histidine kinase [Runella zeae]|uniref:histidine kinase n=1 Tax=Runella zeae TaxID=94255 RepID=UPI0023539028|nr:histidine kinase [Runella zeae]